MFQGGGLLLTDPLSFALLDLLIPTSRERTERICEPLWMSMVLVNSATTTLKSNKSTVWMQLSFFTALHLCLLMYGLVAGIL